MRPQRQRAFTLIELMVTIAVAVILMSIATPAMTDLIASQRVRAAATQLLTDLSYARADAVNNQRMVAVMRLDQSHDAWHQGWRVVACSRDAACASCVDPSAEDTHSACLETPLQRQALGGRIRLCTRLMPDTTAIDTPTLVFAPDGRMLDTAGGASLHINAFMVSDDMGDSGSGNDKLRALEFAGSGRISLHEVASGGGTPCP